MLAALLAVGGPSCGSSPRRAVRRDGPSAPVAAGAFAFAPYIDVTLPSAFHLTAGVRSAGVRDYTLGFMDSVPGSCQAAWGGRAASAPGSRANSLAQEVDRIRASSGDVAVSFGGSNGTELARACGSPVALAAQYRAVASPYGATRLDFDLEGPALASPQVDDRRSQAIAALQSQARAAGAPLEVSLTLPVEPAGLPPAALAMLRSALDHGVAVTLVNLLAMDYGDSAAPRPAGRMGRYAVQAAESAQRQLAALFRGRSDASLWAMIGITPMIGRNDVASEVFTLRNARELLAFARRRGIGALSMWSASRDRPCPRRAPKVAVPTCSGIRQAPGAFARIFGTFRPTG